MKAKLFLRIAAGLIIFHLLGHTFGHLNWKKAVEPEKHEVIKQMTEHKFPFMGKERSMGDYYEGYGWACCITFILIAAVLWIISETTEESKKLTAKISLVIGLSLIAWCIIEFMFFFPFAASTTLLSAIFILISFYQIKKNGEINT